jgi:hypothetical protein
MSTYYVSSQGSSDNLGTLEKPLTLDRALEIAKAGDKIQLRGGTYRETMRPQNSGTSQAPITIESYNNEQVTIDGTQAIAPGKDGVGQWQAHDLNNGKAIYKISLPQTWQQGEGYAQIYNQLFVNEQMVSEARWPNLPNPTNVSRQDYAISTGGAMESVNGNKITGSYENPEIASFWKGGQINFASGSEWGGQSGKILDASNGKIRFEFFSYSNGYGNDPNKPSSDDPFLLTGKLEALDSPGEWFLDAKGEYGTANTLYLWAPNGQNPSKQNIEIKNQKTLLDLSDRDYIHIKDLQFKGGNIWSNSASEGLVLDGITSQYAAHNMSGIEGAVILDGKNNQLINSEISKTQGAGLYVNGENQRVENNKIHDIGYDFVGFSGIETNSKGSQIINNTVYNTIGHGISFSGLKNGKVNYNEVYNTGRLTTDIAGINAYGSEDLQGTEVAYNWVRNINAYYEPFDPKQTDNHNGGTGIRIDSGGAENEITNVRIHHNRVANTSSPDGIVIFQDPTSPTNGNTNISVYNNTTDGGLAVGGKSLNTGTTIANNIALRTINDFRNNKDSGGVNIANNLDSQTDPQLVNPGGDDFRLKSGSPAINKATLVAGINDKVPDGQPDIGALEYEQPLPSVGAQSQPVAASLPYSQSNDAIAQTFAVNDSAL